MKRDINVDNLRGLAIILMIISHVVAYYRSDPVANFLWIWGNFSVQMFIFCSLFLFFVKPTALGLGNFFSYLKKRFIRLLKPYYIFLIFYFIARFFLYKHDVTMAMVENSLYFSWMDPSWLVVLFLALSVLTPVVYFMNKKNLPMFYLYGIASLVSSVYFSLKGFGNYKLVMWLPWSIMIYFTFYFFNYRKNDKKILGLAFGYFLIFALTFYFHFYRDGNFDLFMNKYPPDLYFMSFGLGMVSILYFLSEKGVFNGNLIKNTLNYFSRYSYTIFFIQFLVISILDWTNFRFIFGIKSWYWYFLLVVGITYVLQLSFDELLKMKGLISRRSSVSKP